MGTAASGIFQAPMKLITFLQYVGLSTANGVAPRLARSHGHEPNVAALRAALRGLIAFQCVLLAPAIVWAGPITGLVLGPGYAGAAGVLTALAPYIFFSGLAPTVTLSVNYVGEARRRVPIALATVVLSLGGSALLIPSHGLIGAAVATDVAYGFYTLAHRVALPAPAQPTAWPRWCGRSRALSRRQRRWPSCSRRSARQHLSPGDWLLGAIGGVGTYVAMLLFTRELRGRDLVIAFDFLRRVVRGVLALRPVRRSPARRREPTTPRPLTTDAGRLSPADTPGHAPPLAADPGGAAVPEPRPARTRRRGPALHPSVRALEGAYQPQAPTSPRSPHRVRPLTPAAEPPAWLQRTDAPVRRPEPEPPSTPAAEPPAWLQRTDPPVRRPEPEPPSTPAAEPPAWLQRTDPPVRRPEPEPPSTPAAEPPAWARRSSTPPPDPPGRHRRMAGDPAGEIRRLCRPGQTDRPTRSRGAATARPGCSNCGPCQRSPARTRATVIAPTTSIGWVTRCIPLPSPGPGRCIRRRFQRHGRPIRSWSRRLLAQGWERMGMGESWFAHRLRAPATPAASDGPPAGASPATSARQAEGHMSGCRGPPLSRSGGATAGWTAPARAASRCWEGTRRRRRQTRLG